jgi:excisionase family DNA binding protein
MKVKTAAAETDLDEKTIRAAINSGALPAFRVGEKNTGVRIMRDDLEAWLRSRVRVGSDEDREARSA